MEKINNSKKSLYLSSFRMAIATMMSRVLGLVREQIIAAYFGANQWTDAYLLAYRIPNLFRDLLAEGSFSVAFVPEFIESIKKSQESARKLFWSNFLFLFVVTSILSLLMIIFSKELITLFISKKYLVSTEFVDAAQVMLITMAFYLVFVSLAALCMGALNAKRVFFLPAMGAVLFNLILIVTMLLFPKILVSWGYRSIYALSIGVLVAGIGQFLLQIPKVIQLGFKPTFKFNVFHPSNIKILKALGAGFVGFASVQINILINSILATSAGVGAVSWLNYAFRLFQLPIGVIGVSFGSSHLVHFSSLIKENKKTEAVDILRSSITTSLILALPTLLVSYILSHSIIHIIYERGVFDAISTQNTSNALKLYSIGIPFYILIKILTPSFYAIGKQKIVVLCSLASIVVNTCVGYFLLPYIGFASLALATTSSSFINMILQMFFLARELQLSVMAMIDGKRLIKIVISTLITYLISTLCFHYFSLPERLIFKMIFLLCQMSFIVLLFILTIFIFGEKSFILNLLKKLKKR